MQTKNNSGKEGCDMRRSPRSRRGGFSYLELMVTITVFSLMSASLLMNYNKINDKIAVDTEAEKIGQSIREAQVYALAALGTKDCPGICAIEYPGYGINTTPSSNSYIFFADLNDDGNRDGSCGAMNTECMRQVMFPKSIKVKSICGTRVTGVAGAQGVCPSGMKESSDLHITFVGPKTNATIWGRPTTGGDAEFSKVILTIDSKTGYSRTVTLFKTAQIVVK